MKNIFKGKREKKRKVKHKGNRSKAKTMRDWYRQYHRQTRGGEDS